MEDKGIDRRKLLAGAAGGGALLLAAKDALAGDTKDKKKGEEKKPEPPAARFGDHLIPPDKEGGHEKHVPVIEAPETVKRGEAFMVKVKVGTAVAHPNTVEHHVKWIQLYAKEEGGRPMVHVATFDIGPTLARPWISFPATLERTSELYAMAYCNVHGVWDYGKKVTVEKK